MTVKELINELQKMPQDAKVYHPSVNDFGRCYEQEVIFVEKLSQNEVILDRNI